MNELRAILEGKSQWVVLHADAFATMRRMMEWPGFAVDHCIHDPPYTQHVSDHARLQNIDGTIATAAIGFGGIDEDGASNIVRLSLALSLRWCITFCALEQFGNYERAAGGFCAQTSNGSYVRSNIFRKTNPAPQITGDRPGSGAEGFALFHRKGRKTWNRGGKDNVWEASASREDIDHPTVKPLALMIELLLAFTRPGDLVLDAFCGSGTTGAACLRTGRAFIGIESDLRSVRIARARLRAESKGLTYTQAMLDAESGQLPLLKGA